MDWKEQKSPRKLLHRNRIRLQAVALRIAPSPTAWGFFLGKRVGCNVVGTESPVQAGVEALETGDPVQIWGPVASLHFHCKGSHLRGQSLHPPFEKQSSTQNSAFDSSPVSELPSSQLVPRAGPPHCSKLVSWSVFFCLRPKC